MRAREVPSDAHATISLWFISGTAEGLAKSSEFSLIWQEKRYPAGPSSAGETIQVIAASASAKYIKLHTVLGFVFRQSKTPITAFNNNIILIGFSNVDYSLFS